VGVGAIVRGVLRMGERATAGAVWSVESWSRHRGGGSWPQRELGPFSGPLFRCPLQTQTLLTMQRTRALLVQPNLLLCLDAFNTLIKPSIPIHVEYARAATSHGIACGGEENTLHVKEQFKKAFQGESHRNPNYGKSSGLGSERWWANVSWPC
jgi:hypothetical protein